MPPHSPWPNRIAILAALNTIVVLISGALATTSASLATPVAGNHFISNAAHRMAGLHGGSLLLTLLFLFVVLERRAWQRTLGCILVGAATLQGLVGYTMPPDPARWHGVLHAVLAQSIIAGLVVLVVGTLPAWNREQETIQDYGWPSLRSFGYSLPLFVLLQVTLGAMFREGVAGLMPHIAGAMFVSLFILVACTFALQQCATHSILAPSAKALMVLTFTQVFLGIATFTFRSLPKQDMSVILSISSAHIVTGALTLAASVVLGIGFRRFVRPKDAPENPTPA